MLIIEYLEIDDRILDKIESKHNIRFSEVEEACLSDKKHVRKGKEDLCKVFSWSLSGRHVLVVITNQGVGTWKIVTAREMSDSEKQLYRKAIGG
jgi:uncharacterized DUF497 family protein